MFVNLSAASIDKYVWYQYKGKRRVPFDNHNSKYDLDIETDMKFGLRKYGGKLKLVVLTDPDILFTISETEAKKLIRLSKGWSGKSKGIKLTGGTGGKDVLAEPRKAKERKTPAVPEAGQKSKYYPEIPMPPKKADIIRLYNYLNKTVFNSLCPKLDEMKFSRSTKFLALATASLRPNNVTYTLTLSNKILSDPKRIIDGVVHEMIHFMHYRFTYEEGREEYGETDQGGHGPLFQKEMHRLNALGYNITVTETEQNKAVLLQPEYVYAVQIPEGAILYRSQQDFKDKLGELSVKIERRIGQPIVDSYYGKCEDSRIYTLAQELTKAQDIPKNTRLKFVRKEAHSLHEILKSLTRLKAKRSKINAAIVKGVSQTSSKRMEPFNVYLATVLVMADILTVQEVKATRNIEKKALSVISEKELDYIKEAWNTLDISQVFGKAFINKIKRNVLLHRVSDDRLALLLAELYNSPEIRSRFSIPEFSQYMVKSFRSTIITPEAEFLRMVKNYLG